MENTRRRGSGVLRKTITAVFAVAFVASIISTMSAFAAANLFKIQDAKLSEFSTTAEGGISSFDETNIVSNVTFHKLNDSAKYTITLKNTDDKDHIIESITDDNENPYVSYIYDDYANTRVNAGDSFGFVVVAKYTNGIEGPSARAQATDVEFAIQFADIEEPEIISVNPNTGNAIIKNIIVLAISAAGLVVCAIIYAKNHKKVSKLVTVVVFAVIATAIATGVEAATVEINSFTLTTNYELKDKFSVIYTDKEGNEQEIIADYNEPANIPNQDKDGYTLTHWEDEQGNPVDPTQPVTDDLRIHPVYEVNNYTVHFESNNGAGSMADVEKDYDETFTLPTNKLTREGYEFAGWNTESDGTGVHYENGAEVVNLTAEGGGIVTLYAQWAPIRYNIAFHQNADNVSGDMSSMIVAYDESTPLTENAFVLEHYKFMGWNTAGDGTGTPYEDKASIKNLTATDGATIDLYAQWKESVPVELTFYNITEMQQMTADICNTATVPNTNASLFDATGAKVGDKSYIPRRDLIDNRDGKSYQVTKLADGKCWMTENLALGNSDSTMTLTPDDSDVSSDFTLPKSDITAFAGNSDVSAVYVDDTYGGYYSVKTANIDFAEYGKSICPKGWKLPISYNSGDWSALKRKYNIEAGTSSNNALYGEPFNYTRSFYVSNRRIAANGWLDTAYIGPAMDSGSFSNFGVTISDDYSGTASITGAEGGSIRCVAR